eukprot:TRINITY_DN3395_c0_g11_i1.p1 TRINITY_DN3395_c0_g11~~TRINITY_DN3395_c0_g11_i1.p1  ORF type:complete len:327 (-),score=72.99 TRINITY_DN3395_c0_g11_i1:61-1041(-)
MQREGNSTRGANRLIRAMTLLVRSLENVALPELRETLKKLAAEILGLVQQFAGVRDAALQFLSRMVISLGADMLEDVKKVVAAVLSSLDMPGFIQVVHITNLIMQSLKAAAHGFVADILPFLLSSATSMGLPSEAISDLQKTHMDAINTLLKLIRAISSNNCTIFFHLPIDQFNSLMVLLCSCAQSSIEDLRKNGVATMAHFFAISIGRSINADKLIAPAKTAKPTIGEEYASSLLKGALDCAFSSLGLLGVKSPTDVQCIQEVGMLHFLLYTAVAEQFMERLAAWTAGGVYVETMKQGLEAAAIAGSAKQYKELLKQIVGKISKQ